MLTPSLTKGEKKIIRKIALMQLQSLKGIITGNCEQDVVLYCLINEIDFEKLKETARNDAYAFKMVYRVPNNFLTLRKENLSITRHLLANEFEEKKWSKSKNRIWRKIFIAEQFSINSLN